MASYYLMVAAIDFGTSYSDYAFSLVSDFNINPLDIKRSKKKGNGLSLKAPTCLLLNKHQEFVSFGYEAQDYYASLIKNKKHGDYLFFHQFKMILHNNKLSMTTHVEDITGKTTPAMLVFFLFLKSLKEDLILRFIEDGISLRDDQIRWVLTVPGIWSDAAKEFMVNCALEAGISRANLLIALEAEAASIYFQSVVQAMEGEVLNQRQRYMVVEMGGGKTDITVHEHYNNTLVEVCKATGGAFGGTSVNNAFFQLLVETFGAEVMSSFQKDYTKDYLDLMREIETHKRNVSQNLKENIKIETPGVLDVLYREYYGKNLNSMISVSSLNKGVTMLNRTINIDAEKAKALFSNTVNGIVEMITKVMTQNTCSNISHIVLAGGFSESRILQQTIQKAFPGKISFVPDDHSLYVLKGAVLFGHMPDRVTSRVMRFTYVVKNDSFCIDCFSVLMKTNDPVLSWRKITRVFSTAPFHQHVTIPIIVSSNENTLYKNEASNSNGVVHIDLSNQTRLVQVEFYFGDTEVHVAAKDEQTASYFRAWLSFL